MRSLPAASKLLPVPPVDFDVPDLGEEAFNNPIGPEDESLLATGAWGEPDAPGA